MKEDITQETTDSKRNEIVRERIAFGREHRIQAKDQEDWDHGDKHRTRQRLSQGRQWLECGVELVDEGLSFGQAEKVEDCLHVGVRGVLQVLRNQRFVRVVRVRENKG